MIKITSIQEITLLFLSAIFISVRFVSQKISTPIIKLKELSNDVANGNLDVQASLNTNDETEILGNAFNNMIKEIKDSREKLILRHEEEKRDLEETKCILALETNKQSNFSMIGQSEPMKKVFNFIEKACLSDVTVLITGETGVGKELVARAIHQNSPRSNKAFVGVNCAAININLIESELFGSEKGAYTGSANMAKGKFDAANGGTLFLDEIGDMHPDAQVKLLRVLQEKEFYRVGGTVPIKVDVRIIAATNQNLEELIEEKLFRKDLHSRINRFPIEIPPLRERNEDIVLITAELLKKYRAKAQKPNLEISKDAVEVLQSRKWYGNIRELECVIEQTVILANGNIIMSSDIPEEKTSSTYKVDSNGSNTKRRVLSIKKHVKTEEKKQLLSLLQKHRWNIKRTAKDLRTSRAQIYRLVDRYGLKSLDQVHTVPA